MHPIHLLLLLGLLLTPVSAYSVDAELNGVTSALQMHYPKLQFQKITATPIEGIYEVLLVQGELVYFAPRSGHMIFGEIWTNTARNLTKESKARLMTAKLDMFPLDKAIKIGDGPNVVVEVSDPDCPFCRDGSAFFAGRKDVTRFIFLLPLNIHPKAADKARYILSAEDQAAAYEEVMGGHFDDVPLPPFKDNGLLKEHQAITDKVGLRATPRYWINGEFVSGNNLQEFEKLLNQ